MSTKNVLNLTMSMNFCEYCDYDTSSVIAVLFTRVLLIFFFGGGGLKYLFLCHNMLSASEIIAYMLTIGQENRLCRGSSQVLPACWHATVNMTYMETKHNIK